MSNAVTIFRNITRSKLEAKVNAYFDRIKKKKLTPSMTGLALELGCTRKNIIDYQETDEYGDILQTAKLRCENYLEEKMINGTPPTGLIFILKNNYGWNDKVEIDNKISGTISLASLFNQAAQQKALTGTKQEIIEGEIIKTATEESIFDLEEESIFEDKLTNEEIPEDLF